MVTSQRTKVQSSNIVSVHSARR